MYLFAGHALTPAEGLHMITIQTENSIAYAVAVEVASAARALRGAVREMHEEARTIGYLMDSGVIPNPKVINELAARVTSFQGKLDTLRAVAELSGLPESQFDALVAIPDATPTFN